MGPHILVLRVGLSWRSVEIVRLDGSSRKLDSIVTISPAVCSGNDLSFRIPDNMVA